MTIEAKDVATLRKSRKEYSQDVGLVFDASHFSGSWDEMIEKVKIADELGFASVWLGESWGYELFLAMGDLVRATKRIRIGAGIASIYSRTPAVIASAVATLDERSGGRIMLGLGPSGANVVEHWHGVKFEKPIKRLREYVEIIRMILRGEKVVFQGEFFHLERGFSLRFKPARADLPIYIAAMGPKSIVQTGEIADGILPIFWSGHKWGELRALLDEGTRLANRSPQSCLIAPYIPTLILAEDVDEQEIQAARLATALPLAYHIGKMGVYYVQVLTKHGFAEDVQQVLDGWQYGLEAAATAVSSRMLDAVSLVGTPQEIVHKLDQWAILGVDQPLLTIPDGSIDEVGRKLAALRGVLALENMA